MSDSKSPRWGGKPWLLLLLVVSVSSIEVVMLLAQEARVAESSDWEAAGEFLNAHVEPTDGIRVAPFWADPQLRRVISEPLARRLVRTHDVDRFSVVWHVAIRGERHGDLQGLAPVVEHDFGGVVVQRFEKPAVPVAFDFTERLGSAVVTRGDEDAKKSSGWKQVKSRYLEVDFQPRWCVFAHPEKKKKLVLQYPNVPDGKTVVLYTGIGDVYARKKGKGPVNIGVYSGDQPLGEVTHSEADGWKRTELPFRRGDGSLRFEITAPTPKQRQFCFHAELQQ